MIRNTWMRKIGLLCSVMVIGAWNYSGATPVTNPKPTPVKKPNFIVIVGEGHGWSSTSVSMDDGRKDAKAPHTLTPNLAKLSSQGMRMSSFYASCPRCTPSRASFFTGVSPTKLHMTYVNEGGGQKGRGGDPQSVAPDSVNTKLLPPTPIMSFPNGTKTVGDVLRDAGYKTAHFGKWHVGRLDPKTSGFDESDGPNTNSGPGNNRTPNPGEAKHITDEGIAFIEKSIKEGKPFYLHVDHYGGGSQAEVTPETYKMVSEMYPNSREKELSLSGVMHDMDIQIGRLMEKIDDLGLADNTYIVYTADHGTQGNANRPLSRGKGSVLEGGIRIPMIVRGPGIKPGSTSSVRAIGWDLLPTFASISGAKIPEAVEGGSLAGVWKGETSLTRPASEFVIHFPHYDLGNGGPASAIYDKEYKLFRSYETGNSSLFNIIVDPEESKDLAKSQPAKVAELEKRLETYLKSVNAQMPSPNPNFKPENATDPNSQQGGKGGRGGNGGGKGGGKGKGKGNGGGGGGGH